MGIKSFLYVAVAISECMTACSSSDKGTTSPNDVGDSIGQEAEEVAFPEIPDSIVDYQERADFVVCNYWEALDFERDGMASDTAFMEQSFSNFIALLPLVSKETAECGVGNLIGKADASATSLSLITWIAEKYLDDPNSPMRSEEIYIMFLSRFIGAESLSESEKERMSYRMKKAMLNRPGKRGEDFKFIDRKGVEHTLRNEISADTTMVMFYDPDCQQCEIIGKGFAESDASKRFRVLAIDVSNDKERWERTKPDFSSNWNIGFALTDLEDEDKYSFPALPSFYLMAPDGTVLIKDIPPGELIHSNK